MWTLEVGSGILSAMKTLQVDDATFADWEQRAKARGLTVEEWLKVKANGADAHEAAFDAEDQHNRMREFEASLQGQGGRPSFNRHDLYD